MRFNSHQPPSLLKLIVYLITFVTLPIALIIIIRSIWLNNFDFRSRATYPDVFASWEVGIDHPISVNQLASMGGEEKVQKDLIEKINSKISNKEIKSKVTSATKNNDKIFTISLIGNTNLTEMTQLLYEDLGPETNPLGGPTEISLKGSTVEKQSISIILEANLSTGYQWFLKNTDDAFTEESPSKFKAEKDISEDLDGYPTQQTISLKSKKIGINEIKLKYEKDWESEISSRKIKIIIGEIPEGIDLSNPAQKKIKGASTTKNNFIIQAFTNFIKKFKSDLEPDVKGDTDTTLPSSFDWRKQVTLPSVRNQGSCGSCWAFATVGPLESTMVIQGKMTAPNLSEQFLVSCNSNGWSCNGGGTAHPYHVNKLGNLQTEIGAVLETAFPYKASDVACISNLKHPYKAAGWAFVSGTPAPVDAIKQAIFDHGPVKVSLCVGPAFRAYKGGVFSTDESSLCSLTNHAVVLVGWDETKQAWILRNSWGASWGDGTGHMLIKYGTSRVGSKTSYIDYIAQSTPTPTPTPTPTSTPTPTPTPTPTSTPSVVKETIPPIVAITEPVNNTTITRLTTLTIKATATDNTGGSGMNRVEFYINNKKTCTDSTEPYSCNWKATGKPGQIKIEARAFDNANNRSSDIITITSK